MSNPIRRLPSGPCRVNEYFSPCGRSGVEATRLTENRTQYPPFASTTNTWPSRSSSTSAPGSRSRQLIVSRLSCIDNPRNRADHTNTAKGAAAARKPIQEGSTGCAVVNRIGTCSLADRRPTACDLNWRPRYAFVSHSRPLYALAMNGRREAALLSLNRFCQTGGHFMLPSAVTLRFK